MKHPMGAIDPAHRMNVYFCTPTPDSLLGWAHYPWDYAENDYRHGLVIRNTTLPGGDAPFDLGLTVVHEAGHYLGLFHTFEGGCGSPGDQVDDTPYEASAASGCPVGRDTCPSDPGNDPITNYMDYTDDTCYDQFTPGQGARINAMLAQFRSHIQDWTYVAWWNAGNQAGTCAQPFQTVPQGVAVIPTGEPLFIAPGNYAGVPPPINRAMVLRVWGTGVVTIGQ